MASETPVLRIFRNKNTGVVWEVSEGSEAFKRCKRLPEFEEVKPEQKKPEKSG